MTPDELESIKRYNKMGVGISSVQVQTLIVEIEHLQQYKEFYDSIPTLSIVTCPDECGNKQANTGGPMKCAGCEKHFLSDEWS